MCLRQWLDGCLFVEWRALAGSLAGTLIVVLRFSWLPIMFKITSACPCVVSG